MHWDGNTWSNDGLYQYGETFTGITAVSSTNIWVAGYNPDTATDTATMYHWDGVNWSDVSITGGDASTNPYYVTNVPGSNFVWALASTMAYPSQTRLIQYSNAGGTIIPNPDPSAALHSIAASSTNNSMAVGNNAFGTFAEHWNGSNWSISKSLNPGGNSTLQSLASIPGTNKYWAVGSYSPYGSITHTLIESYC